MPYAIRTLAHPQHHGVVCRIVSDRHGIMRVRAKPRLTAVKPSLHPGTVIIEDNFPAVDPAGQPSPANFHLRRFVARQPCVRNRDTPEPRRTKAGRWSSRVHVAGSVAHFIGNSRILRNYEPERAATSLRRCHSETGCGHLVRNNGDQLLRRDRGEDCLASPEPHLRSPRQVLAADLHPGALGAMCRRKSEDLWRRRLCPGLKRRKGKQDRSRQSAYSYPGLSIAAGLHKNLPNRIQPTGRARGRSVTAITMGTVAGRPGRPYIEGAPN